MAGNAKPNIEGLKREIQATINSAVGYQNQKGPGLFDGNIAGDYGSWSVFYFFNSSSYLDITIADSCNIWSFTESFGNPLAAFTIKRYEDASWVDVTSNFEQQHAFNKWIKSVSKIPKGRYRFTTTHKVEKEWYLEATSNVHVLYRKDSTIYGMNNKVFTKLTDDWTALTVIERKALFETTNYETASAEDLATLGKFKVLTCSDMEDKSKITVDAAPKDQLILPKGLIITGSFEGIDKATLTNTASGNGTCKLLITTDLTTYQTYDFTAQEWQTVDHTDLAAVKEKGITASQLPTIDRAAWDKITAGKQGIGFAYLLGIESTSDVCSVDNLNLTVDMKGSWDKAIHGTDYIYGYPANNVLKVMLKSNGDYKINYSEGAKEI